MAVTSCRLKRESRSLTGTNFDHRYQVKWRVESDDPNDGPLTILVGAQSAGPNNLPAPRSSYSLFGDTDPSSFATRYSVLQVPKEPQKWEITYDYEPAAPGQTGTELSEPNPLLRPIKFRGEYNVEQKLVDKAKNVTALPNRPAGTEGVIENAAGDQYDEPIYTEKRFFVLVAEKNFATLQEMVDLDRLFEDKTNDATFYGSAAGTVKYLSIGISDLITEDTVEYYKGTIRVEFREEGFNFEVVNRGYRWRPSPGDEPTNIDETGHKNTELVLLETDGTRLPTATLGNHIEYEHPGGQQDFGLLGIGG